MATRRRAHCGPGVFASSFVYFVNYDCFVHWVNCGLVTDYVGLEAQLTLPDPDDRHVLAAVIFCQAGKIVTFNLRDFPTATLELLGITVQHPDEFIEHAFGIGPAAVIGAVQDHRASLKHLPMTVDDLLNGYMKQGLVTTVCLLQPYAAQL